MPKFELLGTDGPQEKWVQAQLERNIIEQAAKLRQVLEDMVELVVTAVAFYSSSTAIGSVPTGSIGSRHSTIERVESI
jgi:hypothetical protein